MITLPVAFNAYPLLAWSIDNAPFHFDAGLPLMNIPPFTNTDFSNIEGALKSLISNPPLLLPITDRPGISLPAPTDEV